MCNLDEIAAEIQVMIVCPLYNNINATLYDAVLSIDNGFNSDNNMDKYLFLLDKETPPKPATQYYIKEDMLM